jgi:Tetratricopeptide repeat
MVRRALVRYEKALGLDHPSTLNAINNLVNLYVDQGKTAEAEQISLQHWRGTRFPGKEAGTVERLKSDSRVDINIRSNSSSCRGVVSSRLG